MARSLRAFLIALPAQYQTTEFSLPIGARFVAYETLSTSVKSLSPTAHTPDRIPLPLRL